MKGGMLWHRQESTGRRQTFQDQMYQVVVPTTERYDIMHGFHTKALAHSGFDKTYLAVSRVYFFNNMYKMLKIFIRTCPDCQTAKSYHKFKVFLKFLIVRLGFVHTLHLDYSGPYPDSGESDRYICAIVDSFNSYCWLYGTKDMTAITAVKCLLKVVGQIGEFKKLVTDRAAAFLGSVMTAFCKLFDITKISTTAYSPRWNSRVERLQGTLINCLRATCTEGRPWLSALAFVEMALRSAPVKGMGISAFEMINGGRRMCLPIDIAKIVDFDDEHKTPQDTIKEMRTDLDLMNKIIQKIL